MDEQKGSSHWGALLAAGIVTGIAAALFLTSKKGKELTKEGKEALQKMQKTLAKKLHKVEHITKEKYEEMVDEIVAHYHDTKDFAEDELKHLRTYLVDRWDDIRSQLH